MVLRYGCPSVASKILSTALAACVAVGVGWADTANDVHSIGSLSIASDPDRASVFVDGRVLGETPIEIPRVAAGRHRVRVVKSGYLENSRIITVSARRKAIVNVRLTRTVETSKQTGGQGTSAGGWSSNKWLWVGVAGAGAVTAAVLLTKNSPPSGGFVVTPNGTGMAGQTNFTFRSSASDPDNDPLTLTWNFGDGGSGTGETITHTYAAAGTYQVQLAISDGKHTVNAPAATVVVGPNIAGTWTGGTILMPDPTGNIVVNCGLSLELTQNGESLSGSMRFAGGCTGGPGALSSGTASPLTHPSRVAVASGQFTFPPAQFGTGLVVSFVGMTNTAGNILAGNVTLSRPASNFVRTTATSFTKQ